MARAYAAFIPFEIVWLSLCFLNVLIAASVVPFFDVTCFSSSSAEVSFAASQTSDDPLRVCFTRSSASFLLNPSWFAVLVILAAMW